MATPPSRAREGSGCCRRDMTIDGLNPQDWDAVRAIYIEGIATGNATFQQTAPEWKDWDEGHLAACRLAARSGDEVLGGPR